MKKAGKFVFLITSFLTVSGLLAVSSCWQEQSRVPEKANEMVAEMLAASESHRQILYLTKTYGSFSVEQAYRIQTARTKGLSEKLGGVAAITWTT